MKNARRGQATVETALGMLVFVSVMMFGVFFGEVSVMNMKVSEAANAAMWDTSAEKLHDYSGLWSQNISGPAGAAGANALQRYKNFDGRTAAAWPSVAGNNGTFTGAFTRATGMTVQCSSNNAPNYTRFPYPPLWLVFPNPDNGVTCNAFANAQMIRVPTQLADQGNGLFKDQHQDTAAFQGMRMCASGRPTLGGGSCRNNGFGTLMDDFGYATGNGSGETANCSLLPYNVPCATGNLGFWTASFTVWLVNTFVPPGSQDGSDSTLVQAVYQSTPWWPWVEPILGPTGFGMSSCQEGNDLLCVDWMQTEIWASDGMFWSWVWNTTPFLLPFGVHVIAYAQRDQCYLGRSCGIQEGHWNP